ncbi:MAG: ABC transporter substrate-binding protein [Candidatus Eisenbacteria bacterium]|nr:ABC transporter substrate-binding protein [Candidatus Eisenbacteria bacterium]
MMAQPLTALQSCRPRRTAKRVGSVGLLLLAALCACATPRRAPPSPPAELRVPLVRDIQSLDPLDGDEIVTFNVIRQIYEGLVDYDPATLAPVPRLARGWRVTGGGRLWTFELQPGVRFTDDPCFPGGRGRTVTAADVRYSIERGLRRSRGTAASADLPPIAGLGAFLTGAGDHVAGIETPASLVVAIRLERPDASLLHFLAGPRSRVVAREAVEAYRAAFGTHAVGTGPFRLVSWEPLSGILLVRHRAYWRSDSTGARLPCVDALRFVPFWTEDRNRLFADGRIDMVFTYVPGGGSSAPAGAGVGRGGPSRERQFFVSRLNTVFLRFDHRSRHPAVRDRRLREALSCAVQRPGANTTHVAARGLLPPGLPGYDAGLEGQRTDSTRALALLAAAGHPRGRGLPPLRIVWREWDGRIGERLAAGLRRFGFQVSVRLCDDRGYWAAVDSGAADLFRDGWMADYPDPQTFLQLFSSASPGDRGSYRSPQYDRHFLEFRAERDPARRLALARRLERLLISDVAALFLDHERERQTVAARVEGWDPNCTNPLNVCYYEYVRVRPPATAAP